MTLSDEGRENLKGLGERLRAERLRRNETQQVFAARIGASVPTLQKMEVGNPSVQYGSWVAALDVLGRQSDLKQILSPPEDLFAKYEQTKKPQRRRSSRKRVT